MFSLLYLVRVQDKNRDLYCIFNFQSVSVFRNFFLKKNCTYDGRIISTLRNFPIIRVPKRTIFYWPKLTDL